MYRNQIRFFEKNLLNYYCRMKKQKKNKNRIVCFNTSDLFILQLDSKGV